MTQCFTCRKPITDGDGLPCGADYPGKEVHNNDDCIRLARERMDRDAVIRKAVSGAMDALYGQINGHNAEMVAGFMVARARREHRTLQQGLVSAIKSFIEQYAEFDTDLRNEDAVKWCKMVRDASKDSYMRFI